MPTLDQVLAEHPLPLKKPDGSPAFLNPLQIEDINKIAELGRALCDLPVGYGKTVIATCVAFMLDQPTTVVLVPPILVPQWVKWLRAIPGAGRVVEYAGGPAARRELKLEGARWIVSSYGMFKNDLERFEDEVPRATTIMDECFVAGTLVNTPGGERPIETLQAGELVFTSGGPKRIVERFDNLTFQLTTLELSDGSIITCTPDHPIFTELGWMPARSVGGRWVLPDAGLPDVRQGVREEDLRALVRADFAVAHRAHLFETMQHGTTEDVGSGILQAFWAKDARATEERAARGRDTSGTSEPGAQGEHLEHAADDRLEASSSQGQRDRDDTVGSFALAGAGAARLQVEPCSGFRPARAGLSHQLQTGLWTSGDEGRAGAGRGEPLVPTAAGSKEGVETGRVRVVRVSTTKRSTGTPVYNLHVEGRHDYFAGGILVHNCQNAKSYKSQMFKSLSQFADGQPLLLMSGTIMSKPSDGYAYVKLNSPHVYPRYKVFENLHVSKFDFFDQPVEWQNLDMLQDNLDLARVKRTKEEVHAHLPKVNYVPIEYELAPEHMKLYRKLMDEQLLEHGEGKIDATTAGKLFAASQQIIANWGHFADDESKVARLYELVDATMDEIGIGQPVYPGDAPRSKLIIWSIFKRTSRSLLAYLNEKAVITSGKNKGKQAWRAVGAYGEVNSKEGVRAFLEDDDALILVAQPGSAGAGLNPQHLCWESLFAETPTTTIPFAQCCGRIDREGQVNNPTIRIAVAKGTVQQSLLRNLFENDKLVQSASGSIRSIKDLIYPK